MGLKDRTRIERLVREQQPVTADTALRLGRVFGTTADYWINLQTAHDLSAAAIKTRDELTAIRPIEPTQPRA
jgi:addiction module HigA family antidote